ncbi:hypothetical protein AT269_02260 [Bacillus cereus]|nr:hypothetical protein AT269_02260 [Bacillus cereus]
MKTESDYETYRKNGSDQLPVTQLKTGWQEAKYIALYAPKKWYGEKRWYSIRSKNQTHSNAAKR